MRPVDLQSNVLRLYQGCSRQLKRNTGPDSGGRQGGIGQVGEGGEVSRRGGGGGVEGARGAPVERMRQTSAPGGPVKGQNQPGKSTGLLMYTQGLGAVGSG